MTHFLRHAVVFGAMIANFGYAASNTLGLAITYTGTDGKSHTTSRSNIALYVAEGEAASPFIAPGPFTAVWEGNIHADLRGQFYFQAELNGRLALEINTNVVDTPLRKPVGLNKGANKIKATYTSPKAGDAYVRLSWTEKGTNASPIPPHVLSHAPPNNQLELGRELFLEFRCNKCHSEVKTGVPELAMDAPSFEGIGMRRNVAWMARWILNPKGERASAHMPKLARSPDEAEAMAAFLASLKTGAEGPLPDRKQNATPPEGKTLYEALLCASCHDGTDLGHVGDKFPPGKLAEYLLVPEAQFAWTRMPNFKLSHKEAETLASHLLAGKEPQDGERLRESLIESGRSLVQMRGCLNCHTLNLENKFTAPKLGTNWNKGCVTSSSNAPQFDFNAAEREALVAFSRTDRASLTRHVPAEFAERQMRLLNCRGCHGQQEAFPPVDILGGKLRPEWSGAFIAGDIRYKPRAETHPRGEPWLFARMPSFGSRASALANGMAALHGYAPKSPAPPRIDPDLVEHGRKLIGKDGGFSCVSCHAVGSLQAADVFDSEGINLAWSSERLLEPYYRRWVRNPLSIDPQTKMPVYFDEEGRSPLTEVLDGDGEKQLTAMWHYLLMGEKMRPPSLGAQ
ncbi:MAG TPA: c-type cytochrome [Verrucomicrobiae bacterium]|nr:c-type cytochrome [Verrucomicrobiae bacterium]